MSGELNPYETPKAELKSSSKIQRDPFYVAYSMQSTRAMSVICRVVLGLFSLLCLLLVIWDLKLAYEYDITDEYEGLGFLSFDEMLHLEMCYVFLFCGSMVAVAFWKYRSMKNAWAIMKTGVQPTVSPGWSVAWYIIPIASLWKPFTAMSEINQNSADKPAKLKYWLRFWWLFWIAGNIFSQVTDNSAGYLSAGDLQQEAMGIFCMGAAAFCLERIISSITKSQMEEFDKSILSKL